MNRPVPLEELAEGPHGAVWREQLEEAAARIAAGEIAVHGPRPGPELARAIAPLVLRRKRRA